jgi:glycosyltransferase involved in cell wall biosynthesis
MCEAFAKAGAEVELVVPWRYNSLKEDPYKYYMVEENFSIRRVPSFDLVWFGKIGFFIQEWTFFLSAVLFLLFSRKGRMVYVRGERLARGILSVLPPSSVVLETHIMPKDFNAYEKAFRHARSVVVVTRYYENELRDKGITNIFYAPDAVTISDFDIAISKADARKELGLPLDKKLAIYTGHLYVWKGVDVLAQAAQSLQEDTIIVFVGGSPEDITPFRKNYAVDSRISILGQHPYKEIPLYLKAADVLVLPNTAKESVSRWYTSPIKLFEYMASGRPIVASDLPSIRDVLDETNAVLVPPDEPEALAQAITDLCNDAARADAIATMAYKDVAQYTWKKRAQSILDFVFSNES